MELIPEWAPNIHPILVHFPIAILLLAVLMDLLSFFLPDEWWDDLKSTILYVVGTISAGAAYYTGAWAADSVFLPSEAQNVLNNHALWALWTLWFFGVYTALRLLLHEFNTFERKGIRLAAFILALPGVFLLYGTGDRGAKLVFGYGTGTGQLLQQQETAATAIDSLANGRDSNFRIEDNGNWAWEIGPDGVSALLSRFQWLEGSAQDLQPVVVGSDDNHLLKLTLDSGSNFFVERNRFKNVQIDYYMDISDLDGEISFVNHVQGAENYDFVTLSSNGTITQGRVSDGKREVFAKEEHNSSGMLFIRIVGNGTHFRAYINKELAVHGHDDAPDAGNVGLKLDGSGTLFINSISLTQLD